MADINQVITLGIGTPAGIREFLTFGLQIGAAQVLTLLDVAITDAATYSVAITDATTYSVSIMDSARS